jgi:hypothetical protein
MTWGAGRWPGPPFTRSGDLLCRRLNTLGGFPSFEVGDAVANVSANDDVGGAAPVIPPGRKRAERYAVSLGDRFGRKDCVHTANGATQCVLCA